MARLCLPLLCFLLLAGPAQAAPFGELPPTVLDGSADCLRETGAPGELVVDTRGPDGLQFLQVSASGIVRGERLAMPWCAAVVSRPNGAAVAAGAPGSNVVAAVRDPGGTWRLPMDLDYPSNRWRAARAAVGVSDRGDAIVAWGDYGRNRFGGDTDPLPARVRVARRVPGGEFGAPVTLANVNRLASVRAGVARTGEAVVVWSTIEGSRVPYRETLHVAVAAPGAAFGAPVTIGDMPWRSSAGFALAQDGRALVAFPDGNRLRVVERQPGGAFGQPVDLAPASDAIGVHALAALDEQGRAAIAWRGAGAEGARIVTRATLGAFSAPTTLLADFPGKRQEDPFDSSESVAEVSGWVEPAPAASLALTSTGAAIFAAAADAPWSQAAPTTASLFTVNGGSVARQTLNTVFSPAESVAALTLADGTSALAFAASASNDVVVHAAAEGVTETPDGPLPQVRVSAPRRPVVVNGSVRLPVRCSGPCEVAADVIGHQIYTRSVHLPNGGKGLIELFGPSAFAPRKLGPVRVRVTYGVPGARHPQTRIVTLRLRRAHTLPSVRVSGVTAKRRAGRVIVTWRTDVKLPESASAYVSGATTRTWSGEPLQLVDAQMSKGKRTFSATLTRDARRMRWVSLRAFGGPITVKVK